MKIKRKINGHNQKNELVKCNFNACLKELHSRKYILDCKRSKWKCFILEKKSLIGNVMAVVEDEAKGILIKYATSIKYGFTLNHLKRDCEVLLVDVIIENY